MNFLGKAISVQIDDTIGSFANIGRKSENDTVTALHDGPNPDLDWSAGDPQLPVLAGLTVVRLGKSLAGNFLARILADQGARISTDLDDAPRARLLINDLGRGVSPPTGFDFESLAKTRSRLVYCSLVSFPEGGPSGNAELEDEPVLAALGFNRYSWDAPRREPLKVASFFGAVYAAIYIACALRPNIDGQGPQHIEVPLFSAALNVLGRASVTLDDPRFAGVAPGTPNARVAEAYKCADGKYFHPHGMYPHFAKIICQVGGHPEWADDAAAGLRRVKDKQTEDQWRQRFAQMWLQRPAHEWEEKLARAHGSGTVIRTHEEWRSEQHARASEIFVRDAGQKSWRVGPAVRVHANLAPGRKFSKPKFQAMQSGPGGKPLPLGEINVVDFCIVIAGPTMGRILADLGANVVKVDAPNRGLSPYLWFDVNRTKRSIVLDLRHQQAREIAHKLVERADVVTDNFRAGKLKSLGFDYDELSAQRPELIFGSANAMDYGGPWEERPGWERNAQAATGQQMARSSDGVPGRVIFPVNDYATGMLAALGVVLAILRRDLTGVGSRARTSLARSGTFLQLCDFEPNMKASPGLQAGHIVKCRDGWVSAWLPMRATIEQERVLAQSLASAADTSCANVEADLRASGISAMRERTPVEMANEPWVAAAGLAVRWFHPLYGWMSQTTPRSAASSFETSASFPSPAPGADGQSILKEIGMNQATDSLIASGAMSEKMPLFSCIGV